MRDDPFGCVGRQEDARRFKLALLASICFHLVLFWTMFPVVPAAEVVRLQKDLIRISFVPPPPPEEIPLEEELPLRRPRRFKPYIGGEEELDEPIPWIEPQRQDLAAGLALEPEFVLPEPEPPPERPQVPGGDIAPPVPLTACFAGIEYTEVARIVGVEGYVVLQAVIDARGQVRDVQVLKGLGYGLNELAVTALKSCTFRPGHSRATGRPVEVIYTLTVRFHLARR